MSVTFKNAPLVELIAELRWIPTGTTTPVRMTTLGAGASRLTMVDGRKAEDFYMRFGGELYSLGYQRSERLVPPGFPSVENQAVVRFRSEGGSEMFQVGHGVFAANAVQPYQSWKMFSPHVRKGVECLLRARPEEDRDTPFSATLLRYIDAFNEDHTGGQPFADFVREVLGFKIDIPAPMARWFDRESSPSVNMQYSTRLSGGQDWAMTLADAVVGGRPSLVLDMTVSTSIPISPDADSVMLAFGAARDIAHDMFVGITKPIHAKLNPE